MLIFWCGWPAARITGFGGIKPWVFGYFYSSSGHLLIDHKILRWPIGYRGDFFDNNTPYRSAHAGGGASFTMADGRVTHLSPSTDLVVLKAMATRANGEVIPEH